MQKEFKVGLTIALSTIATAQSSYAQDAVSHNVEPHDPSPPVAVESKAAPKTQIETAKPTLDNLGTVSIQPEFSPLPPIKDDRLKAITHLTEKLHITPVASQTESKSVVQSSEYPIARAVENTLTQPISLIIQPEPDTSAAINPTLVNIKTPRQDLPPQLPIEWVISAPIVTPSQSLPNSSQGVITFGDSLSDNGNLFKTTQIESLGKAPYFEGRASNGLVWVEELANSLQVKGSSKNFAVGGATSHQMLDQVNQYVRNEQNLNPNNIYTLWSGTNDYYSGKKPESSINIIKTAINTLTEAGAQKIIVANLMLENSPLSSASSTPEITLSQRSKDHNQQLHQSLMELAKQNPSLSIIPLDVDSLFNAFAKDPNRFGFTKESQSCLVNCVSPDKFIFLDIIHGTAAANRILSDYTLSILTAPQAIAPQADLALGMMNQTNQRTEHQLDAIPQNLNLDTLHQWSVFTSGGLTSGDRENTNSRESNINVNTTGVTIGTTYTANKNLTVGVSFNHVESSSQLSHQAGEILADSNSLSVYGRHQVNRIFTDAILNYGWNHFDITRNLNVSGFDAAKAHPNGNQFSAKLKMGYDLGSNGLHIKPIIGLSHSQVNIDKYSEQYGDILNLNVKSQREISNTISLGTQVAYDIKVKGATITPYFNINIEHSLTDNNRDIITELATQPGIPIRNSIGKIDRDLVRLGLGMRSRLQDAVSVMIDCETTVGQHSSTHSIQGQVQYYF